MCAVISCSPTHTSKQVCKVATSSPHLHRSGRPRQRIHEAVNLLAFPQCADQKLYGIDTMKNPDDQLLAEIRASQWHHNFEILPGIWTNGTYNPQDVFDMLELPEDMKGLRVADIGASNGFYSFKMYERGADVTAFDFRHERVSGFFLAKKAKGYEIPHHQVNILEMQPDRFGKFDIVLFLGVIYHLPDPLKGLRNAIALSRKRLLVESYCIDGQPGIAPDLPLVTYRPDPRRRPDLNNIDDSSNFWGFSSTALRLIVEDYGCIVNGVVQTGDRVLIDADYIGDRWATERTSFAYGFVGSSDSELRNI